MRKYFLLLPALAFGSPTFGVEPVDYIRQVKPLLAAQCYNCHGAKAQKGGLRVDTAAAMLKGGDRGPAIVAGKSKQSLLVLAMQGAVAELSRMPYKKEALPADQIALVARWIDEGAKAPADEPPDDGRNHWAFRPPVRPPLPSVKNLAWVRNDMDRFILARLERQGLAPSAEADRATLIRRVSLDLTGLPPTLEEVDRFVNDTRPDAYERLVDRLLASPHYGERWGRVWLDLARYADSNGYSIDGPREIWKYRDWVINALNKDMSFRQFVIEQMAGDLLPQATVEQRIATGFHRNTQINQEGGIDREQFRVDAVADRVSTTGQVFLGLTLGCARCHDHKFDPITQKEFFQLFAILNNQDEPTLPLADPHVAAEREAIRKQIQALEAEALAYQTEWLKKLTDEERNALPREVQVILNLGFEQRDAKQKQVLMSFFQKRDGAYYKKLAAIAALEKKEPKFPTTMVLRELPRPRETHIHIGGDFTRKGERVGPGALGVLHPFHAGPKANRLDLAKWLVSEENPLVARVTVNRFWQHYFGKGLVETENDFGTQGLPPTHPELLDWLAVEFMARDWSMKAMHRLIVTSATYRQSSHHRSDLAQVDPRNLLLGRQNRLRLDAEIIRDAALTVSGKLNPKIGGPSVFPPQPEGVFRFTQVPREWQASTGEDRYRRGLYTYFWRSAPYPALIVFDAPDATASCTRRNRSNTPLQALTLLNDEAFFELAQALGDRVRASAGDDFARVERLVRLALSRKPSAWEKERLVRFLVSQRERLLSMQQSDSRPAPANDKETADRAAWTMVARVVMNLDEFITRE